ncbi:hypothetical protein A3K63_03015 [Candidatus Micrarchaeota archaeon RBG_16_49_10]|nr:MAG: hypothetical protein A3K63_03015 [Candidatus Micrarchaeota archaeon RBG_16_49_10]
MSYRWGGIPPFGRQPFGGQGGTPQYGGSLDFDHGIKVGPQPIPIPVHVTYQFESLGFIDNVPYTREYTIRINRMTFNTSRLSMAVINMMHIIAQKIYENAYNRVIADIKSQGYEVFR